VGHHQNNVQPKSMPSGHNRQRDHRCRRKAWDKPMPFTAGRTRGSHCTAATRAAALTNTTTVAPKRMRKCRTAPDQHMTVPSDDLPRTGLFMAAARPRFSPAPVQPSAPEPLRQWQQWPSLNSFYCKGRLMSGAQLEMAGFTLLLLLVVGAVFLGFTYVVTARAPVPGRLSHFSYAAL
jgi:hypothetical protein